MFKPTPPLSLCLLVPSMVFHHPSPPSSLARPCRSSRPRPSLCCLDQAILDEQQHSLKEEMAKQAEARLQYLLRQSDIFQHFGLQVRRTRHQPRRRHIPRATSTTHPSL